MIRSGNPALGSQTFDLPPAIGQSSADSGLMTLQGTVNKCFIMLGLLLLTASYSWGQAAAGNPNVNLMMWGGAIGGFVIALVLVFKKQWAPFLAPAYALVEGLFLGALSAYYAALYEGIVVQAVGLTFAVFGALLMAYKSGMIKATENFKLGIAAATGGVFLFYIVTMALGFFGVSTAYYTSSSPLSIGISLVIVVIAALNLVMDFDFIEEGCEKGAPKYMEWFGAFGLLVTLVWLYIEMLRLLAKLQSRD